VAQENTRYAGPIFLSSPDLLFRLSNDQIRLTKYRIDFFIESPTLIYANLARTLLGSDPPPNSGWVGA
jgi:hypothetical protein